MKTLNDLEKMKNENNMFFENQYEHFFSALVDCYIGKIYGLERIKAELDNWDKEA